MKNRIITIGILMFAGAILLFLYSINRKTINLSPIPENTATTSVNSIQSGKIDEYLTVNNTLQNVNFCGKIYKAKQVFIDEVDVVHRIAELVTSDQSEYGKGVCNRAEGLRNAGWLKLDENEIGVSEVVNDKNDVGDDIYIMSLISPTGNFQSIGDFQINITTKEISIILQGFDGYSIKSIGKFK